MFYRTAESVSPKHPDKLCDRISDAILDAYLAEDPNARVAAETCGGHGVVFVTGEITSSAEDVDIPAIVKRIAGDDVEVHTKVVKQSPEIAQGVDIGGAGDQGIMIGYACDETPEMLPQEVVLARRLNQFIFKKHPFDGKTQVTIRPDGRIDSVVASFQNVSSEELSKLVPEWLDGQGFLNNRSVTMFSKEILDSPEKYELLNSDKDTIRAYINPAGDWSQGGFDADTGLTGRKLIVDNYGPRVAIGGGCYSGKDPSKVDRSAAYMARKIAVDYLRKRRAHEVLVRLAYAIGYAEPLEKTVIVDGKPEEIEGYDLTPGGIIKFLDLKRPIYEKTAEYGHYGEGFDWDK
ncbi:methionine adenosyltransferase domain-containing protein [Candidatus Saccharibacteria bacterium]|nr:methionine adenosyltransferase domain-containing protein [Candidatus Saccharibacteria bacterium]